MDNARLNQLAFERIVRESHGIQGDVMEVVRASNADKRFLIVALARAVDSAHLSTSDSYPYPFGWVKALELLLDSSALQLGVPLYRSNPQLDTFAHQILAKLDLAAQLELIAGLLASSLVDARSVEEGTIKLVIPRGMGAEGKETKCFNWLVESGHARLNEIDEEIEQMSHRLDRLVHTMNGGFITYTEADPRVEQCFGEWADVYLQTRLGVDSFLPDSKFGNIEFEKYCKFARCIVASSRKHIEYCKAAMRVYPQIDPVNVYTVPADLDVLFEECAALLGCSPREAMHIVNIFVKQPGSPNGLADPPYIRVGHNCVFRSIRGALDDIFVYMLESLRSMHRKEWDAAVDSREGIFRKQIAERLLSHGVLCLGGSRNIRIGKNKTDIDLVALDSKKGVLGLFQLKWMDPYGHSLRQRQSRQGNFTDSVNKWADKIELWIEACGGARNAAKTLGLPAHLCEGIDHYRIFAVGRWFSMFSDGVVRHSRTAWLNWVRLLKSLDDLSKLNVGLEPSVLEWLWIDAKGYELCESAPDVSTMYEVFQTNALRIEVSGE